MSPTARSHVVGFRCSSCKRVIRSDRWRRVLRPCSCPSCGAWFDESKVTAVNRGVDQGQAAGMILGLMMALLVGSMVFGLIYYILGS